VTSQQIMEGHYRQLGKKIKGKDLICIQDTSEYNYNHHKHILKKDQLGTISDNYSLGLRVHPMLIMDNDGFPYGISSLQILNRVNKEQDRHERKYQQLPIEEKESYRWIKSIEETKARLSKSKSLTIVADRESDIYQLWSRTLDPKTHLVIRTAFSRKFIDDQGAEIQPVSAPSLLGQQKLYISGKFGKSGRSRTADLNIYAQRADTLKPKWLTKNKTEDSDKISLYVVTVQEQVPADTIVKEPIEWILLTDLAVTTLEEAAQIIAIYKSRWNIEQVFRLTKQKGFGLEESQLETAHGLTNMITLVLIAAIRVFQMVKSRNDEERLATDVFDVKETELLKKINPGLEGKSEKSKNRNTANSLAFYIWIIARLGNWKPEDRDPPGPVTLKRGWDTFNNFMRLSEMIPP
jgi:hypothetical protein